MFGRFAVATTHTDACQCNPVQCPKTRCLLRNDEEICKKRRNSNRDSKQRNPIEGARNETRKKRLRKGDSEKRFRKNQTGGSCSCQQTAGITLGDKAGTYTSERPLRRLVRSRVCQASDTTTDTTWQQHFPNRQNHQTYLATTGIQREPLNRCNQIR